MTQPLKQAFSPQASDAELARAISQGRRGALELLMRRHNRALFRTARAILRDDADAEEALQDAYLQAFEAIGAYRGEAKLSTWLARIVANESLQRLRKRTRRAEILPLAPVGEAALSELADPSMDKSPERSASRAQTRRLLETHIDALPDAYRAVFMLRAVEELPVEEAAQVLGIPEATVRSRFFRARSLLREALAMEIDQAYEDAFAFDGERCDRIVASVLARVAQGGSR